MGWMKYKWGCSSHLLTTLALSLSLSLSLSLAFSITLLVSTPLLVCLSSFCCSGFRSSTGVVCSPLPPIDQLNPAYNQPRTRYHGIGNIRGFTTDPINGRAFVAGYNRTTITLTVAEFDLRVNEFSTV